MAPGVVPALGEVAEGGGALPHGAWAVCRYLPCMLEVA